MERAIWRSNPQVSNPSTSLVLLGFGGFFGVVFLLWEFVLNYLQRQAFETFPACANVWDGLLCRTALLAFRCHVVGHPPTFHRVEHPD